MASPHFVLDPFGREVLLRALLSFSTQDFSLRLPHYRDFAKETVERSGTAADRRDAMPDLADGVVGYRGMRSRRPEDAVVLIVEGDAKIAALMLGLVRRNGYQGEVAADLNKLRGLVRDVKPDAILLGMKLVDCDGWTAFDLLKGDPETRQLPVSLAYANGDSYQCLQMGGVCTVGHADAEEALAAATVAGLSAAVGREIKKLLVVDLAESRRPDPGAVWRIRGLEVTVLGAGAEVVEALRREAYDGMVVGSGLPDMSTLDLMQFILAIELAADLPLAMINGDGDSGDSAAEIAVFKRRQQFNELLTETANFLHRTVGNRPPARRDKSRSRHRLSSGLAGRKVLIVDDDIRNVYAMTGVLEQHGMVVLHAENGSEGFEMLLANPDTDALLLDPDAASQDHAGQIVAIRAIEKFKALPIIAVTAKARHGNRERCLAAGASDYIDKPINVEQLLSLLRAWLIELR